MIDHYHHLFAVIIIIIIIIIIIMTKRWSEWSPVCNLDVLCLAQQIIQLPYLAQNVLIMMMVMINMMPSMMRIKMRVMMMMVFVMMIISFIIKFRWRMVFLGLREYLVILLPLLACPIKIYQSVISLSRTYVSLDIIDATLDRVGWWRYNSVRWEIAWLSLLMEEICLNSKLQTWSFLKVQSLILEVEH